MNSKSKQCFRTTLSSVEEQQNISTRTKLCIFHGNVKSVLLYKSETWKEKKTATSKLQAFVNGCLQ